MGAPTGRRFVAVAVAAASACLTRAAPLLPTYYLSPTGDDVHGNGSRAAPWATLAHARDTLRPLLPSQAADVSVSLLPGVYALTATFTLSPADGGANGHVVTYEAADGGVGSAVLEGGLPVTGWAPTPDGLPALFTAPAPRGATRQLWVDGRRANESRAGVGLSLANGAVITPMGYVVRNDSVADALLGAGWRARVAGGGPLLLQPASDIELLYTSVGCQWVEDRAALAAVALTADGGGLNLTVHPRGWALVRGKPYTDTYPTDFVNVLAALAAVPGTGFLSSAAGGAAYYHALPGQDMGAAEAWAGGLDGPLVALVGDRLATPAPARVANVTLRGLLLRHATWARPAAAQCGGYAPDQGSIFFDCDDATPLPGHATYPVPAAGLWLSTAAGVRVEECVFASLGATAVAADGGSQDVLVSQCEFTDISCSAVRFGEVTDYALVDPRLFNARLALVNSTVLGAAVEYRDCAAVFGGFISDSAVAQNTIGNASWAGVSVGWGGWGGSPDRPTLRANRITGNAITHVNLVTGDGGPIYVMGPQSGSHMTGNYVAHAAHHAAMLYHDEGSAGWDTEWNVVHMPPWEMVNGTGWTWVGVSAWACTEYDIYVNHTWSTLGTVHRCATGGRNVTIANLTVVPLTWPEGSPQVWPAEAAAIIAAAGRVRVAGGSATGA